MASDSKVSLKLLIDKKCERVLFAEASKNFVDFLFQIFSLHLGSVVNVLSKENMVGCLGKLYQSIENLSNTYVQPSANKNNALNQYTYNHASNAAFLLLSNSASSTMPKLYACPTHWDIRQPFFVESIYCHQYVSDDPNAICPKCNVKLSRELSYVLVSANGKTVAKPEEGQGGYVKGGVTYMVMDNLEVKPMSTISSITLLNKFNFNDLGTLEQKHVHLGISEGLKLLNASMQSESVLTDVFLGKNRSVH